MSKTTKSLLSLSLVAALLSGCATDENKNTMKGTGIGALAGAAAGAIIGHQTGNREKGALIGAALGGGAGALIGRRMDKQKKELEAIAETKRTEEGIVTKLKSDILFDTNQAKLKVAAQNNILELANIMKKYPENVLTVRGYTDSTGSDKVNMPLSQNRAEAVKNQLVAGGIPVNTVSAVGMGPANPVDTAKTTAAYSKNRRVEIEITVDESKVPKQ